MENKKIKILAIDDNRDNLISLKALLSEVLPQSVVYLELSGQGGIGSAKKNNPDVILLDIVMPGMDGYEVCKLLKADEQLSETPVIFLTALKGDKQSRILALEAGGDAFLAKPIDKSELTAQIRAMLKIRIAAIEKRHEKDRLGELVEERTKELEKTHIATLNLLEDLKSENQCRKESERQFAFLAGTAFDLVKCTSIQKIYEYTAQKLFELMEDNGIVAIVEFDTDSNLWKMKHLKGIDDKYTDLSKIFGFDIRKLEGEVSTKYYEKITSGKLEEVEFDFPGLFNNKVSDKIGYTVKKLLSIDKMYCIAFHESEQVFGNITLVTKNNTKPVNADLIEAFVLQVTNFVKKQKSEEALRLSKELLSETESIGKVGGWSFNIDTRQQKWTDEVFRIHEVEISPVQSVDAGINYYTKESRPIIEQAMQRAIEHGENYDLELKIITAKGNTRSVHTIGKADLKNRRIYGFFQDITERKIAEDELLKSKSNLEEYFENDISADYVVSVSGEIFSCNKTFLSLFGFEKKSATEKFDITGLYKNPEDRKQLIHMVKKHGKVDNYEVEYISTEGKNIHALINAIGIFDKDNQLEKIRGYVVDITEQKKAQDELQKSEEKYRLLFANNPQPMWIYDLETLAFLEVNQAALIHYGYSKEEFLSMNLKDIRLAEDIPVLLEDIKNTLLEYNTAGEWRHIKKNGEIINVEITSHSLLFNERNARHILINDITERKRVQFEYQTMIKTSRDGFWIVDAQNGKFLEVNQSYCEIIGYSHEELLQMTIQDIEAVESQEETRQHIALIMEKGFDSFESKHKTKSGRIIDIDASVTFIGSDINKFFVFVKEISERKRVENEILKLSHAVEQSPVSIIITDLEGNMEYVNPKTLEITDYQLAEVLGKNPRIFTSGEKPKSEYKILWDTITLGNEWRGEFHNKRKNGELYWEFASISAIVNEKGETTHYLAVKEDITKRKRAELELLKLSRAVEQSPVSITITDNYGNIEYVNPKFTEVTGYHFDEVKGKSLGILKSGYHPRAFYEKLWDTILSGKDWIGEFYNKKKNGELFWEDVIISPIVNESGDITHFIGIEEDITEKKKMIEELITAKDVAEKSNSLKDAFIANISHEIRTPINGILGMTGFIKEIYSPNITDEEEEYFTAIDRSCDRIIRTTDLILNYSQLETGTFTFIPKQIELSSICMDLVSKYLVSAKSKSLSLLFENKIGLTVISADEYSITQVISNLIENAIIYTKRGFVTVKLYQNPQSEILLDVIDSGIGIGEEYLGHIFESYRQEQMGYSRSYDGLGLGLALVKKVLDLHKATISVESIKGEGTTFTINFGKNLQSVEELTAKQNIVTNVEATSTKIDRMVLIVEDDVLNQSVIKKIIDKKYNSLIAESYDSVMEVLYNNKVDLILMDISLQGSKNGLEITKELKASKEYKHIPIIAATAHALERDQNATFDAGCDDYLAKPFTRDQLLEKIEKFIKAGDDL